VKHVFSVVSDLRSWFCWLFFSRLKTVASREEAEKNLQIITHLGACGTCSTLQDLAVYIETPDLASVGIACGFRGLSNFTDGVVCYMENGFTEACAVIWVYNSQQTRRECPSCVGHWLGQLPNNLEPPTCYLAECIQCDEDKSGAIFADFAGRTRRRSGLVTGIVRNCTDVPRLVHRDPCDDSPLTLSLSDPPTMAPTDASSTSLVTVPFLWSTTFICTAFYLLA
jgi:hypothetical protein